MSCALITILLTKVITCVILPFLPTKLYIRSYLHLPITEFLVSVISIMRACIYLVYPAAFIIGTWNLDTRDANSKKITIA